MQGNYIQIDLFDEKLGKIREQRSIPIDNVISVRTCTPSETLKSCVIIYKELSAEKNDGFDSVFVLNQVRIFCLDYSGSSEMFTADVMDTIMEGMLSPNSQPKLKLRDKNAKITSLEMPWNGIACSED